MLLSFPLQGLWLPFQPPEDPAHVLPVGPPPVEALAGRALVELLLALIDKWGDQPPHLLLRPGLQGHVTLKTEREGAVVVFEAEGLHHLAELEERVFPLNPQGLQPPQPHHAALKDLAILGQHHPSFRQGPLYQGPIIVPLKEESIIAHHAKQAGHLPYVHVHQELHGDSLNGARPGAWSRPGPGRWRPPAHGPTLPPPAGSPPPGDRGDRPGTRGASGESRDISAHPGGRRAPGAWER